MGGKLGVTPPVRIQQPATCISTNETLILERVNTARQSTLLLALWFFLTLNMIPCYGIHLTAFCSRSDFQTSLVEILYFPPMSMWWQLQLIISENLRNFGDAESWNSNWQKVKDEVFWSDAPSTWLHLTIRRRSVDAVFRLLSGLSRGGALGRGALRLRLVNCHELNPACCCHGINTWWQVNPTSFEVRILPVRIT